MFFFRKRSENSFEPSHCSQLASLWGFSFILIGSWFELCSTETAISWILRQSILHAAAFSVAVIVAVIILVIVVVIVAALVPATVAVIVTVIAAGSP